MGQMDLSQSFAYFRRELLEHILSSQAAESNGGSLTRVGQIVEAGRKICIANETASGGSGKIRDSNRVMPSVRLINKGENKGMAHARRKEGTFRAPITRVFVQQNRSGKAPDTFRPSAGKGVSVV